MRKLYSPKYLSWLILMLNGVVGCHQDPAIPASAIPPTCQIYRVVNVDEGVRDTTTYSYTAFGHVEESTYRQWVNSLLTISTKQNFTYNADHYLILQVDQTTTFMPGGGRAQDNKAYTYTYQEGRIQQVAINNALSGHPLGFKKYVFDNGNLKTYTETNAQNEAIRSYTFNQTGRITQLTEPGTMLAVVTDGKIRNRILQGGTTVTYEFDNQGQLTKETIISKANQTERTYAYDNAPYWNKTQLLLRGIPSLDLGGHTFAHNVASSTIKRTQNGRIVQDQKFEYQRTYTKAGYSLGYGRSDGARQNIVYANCL